jgi:hypothetical protein
MEVDANDWLEAVLEPTTIDNHVKVDIGCEAACESNPLHFEPMEIDQEPNSDGSHNAYHKLLMGSSFSPEHFQSERNNSHRRYKAQGGETPFTQGATATAEFKPRGLLHRPEKSARVTSLIYRLLGLDHLQRCEPARIRQGGSDDTALQRPTRGLSGTASNNMHH